MPPTTEADVLARYAGLIEDLLTAEPAPSFAAEGAGTVSVERAIVLETAWRGARLKQLFSLIEPLDLAPASARSARIVDRSGNTRGHYRGLLIYAVACAFSRISPSLPPATRRRWERILHTWCGALQDEIRSLEPGAGATTASAWSGLVLFVAGEALNLHPWREAGAAVMTRVAAGQQSTGALTPADPSEHPETTWFHELVALHALATYAARTNSPAFRDAVGRAASYHLNEVQPDHATSEPWGLLAFISNPIAGSLPDQLLHTVRVQQPAGPTGVTRILLADTLQYLEPSA